MVVVLLRVDIVGMVLSLVVRVEGSVGNNVKFIWFCE